MHYKIVTSARSWVGTSFLHQGRVKKTENHNGGCDCLGLIMGVSQELQLVTKTGEPIIKLDLTTYSAIPDTDLLLSSLEKNFIEKNKDQIQPGDLGLFNIGGRPQHLGIIGEMEYEDTAKFTLIHAYQPAKQVCEHILDTKWQCMLVKLYKLY